VREALERAKALRGNGSVLAKLGAGDRSEAARIARDQNRVLP